MDTFFCVSMFKEPPYPFLSSVEGSLPAIGVIQLTVLILLGGAKANP